MNKDEIILDQLNMINEKLSGLQNLSYAQALLAASNNSLLEENDRKQLFNQAMELMGKEDLKVQDYPQR